MNFSRQNSLRGFREDTKKPFFKKKELNIENEQEFPFIHKEESSKPQEHIEEHIEENIEEQNQMNYKEASLTKKQLIQEDLVEPGWTYLHADMLKNLKNKQKNSKPKNQKRNSESDEELNDEEFKKKANRVFSVMINRWDKYKRRNREFYGETHRNEVIEYLCQDSEGEESSDDEENEDNDEYLSS
jgi:hypothetical protein